jgi:hypothetical protein
VGYLLLAPPESAKPLPGAADKYSRHNPEWFLISPLESMLALLLEFVYPPPRSMMMNNENIRFPLTTAAHATVALLCSSEQRGDRNVPGDGHALAERRMR